MSKKKKKNKIDNYIDSLSDIKDKLVIITGANSGIGYELSRIALLKGARLIMACRSLERAEKAKEELIKDTKNDNVFIEKYDQFDIKSVHNFVNIVKEKYDEFYAFILNAGIFLPKKTIDNQHISTVYRNNFLGALVLLDDLKDFLNNAKNEKRIIVQGSVGSFFAKYQKEKFIYGKIRPLKQYCISKLCVSNLYVCYRDDNINPYVKYCLAEPGVATTNLFKNFKKWFKKFSYPFFRFFCNSAREGSLSAATLMTNKIANGSYYHPSSFFTFKGLPTKGYFKEKYIDNKIILDGYEVIKLYE